MTAVWVGGLSLLLLASGHLAYAADVAVDATIAATDCGAAEPTVSLRTDLLRIPATLHVPVDACGSIHAGQFARHHLRTEHTVVYTHKGGPCVYDTHAQTC